jgi:hypothetical protein
VHVVYKQLAAEHEESMSVIAEVEAFRSTVGVYPVPKRLHELLILHFSHEQFPGGL